MKKTNQKIFKSIMAISLSLMAIVLISAISYDPPGPPGKPEIVDVGNDYCTIKFTPPEFTGNSPLTAYLIDARYKGERWERKMEILDYKAKITSLIEGREIQFRVSAVNKEGEGPHSEPSEFVLIKQ